MTVFSVAQIWRKRKILPRRIYSYVNNTEDGDSMSSSQDGHVARIGERRNVEEEDKGAKWGNLCLGYRQ